MKIKNTLLTTVIALLLAPLAVMAAERIVVTNPQAIGLLYVMGVSDKVVGVPALKLKLTKKELGPFYSKYSPNLASATDVGTIGITNIESIFALKPDLVIMSEALPSESLLTKVLKDQKIQVLEVKAGFGSIDSWLKAVKESCEAINRRERAVSYIELWNKNLKMVQERIGKIPEEKRVKVTPINYNSGEVIIRGSRSKFLIELIKLAGGKVMTGDEDPGDSGGCAELVFKYDPDVIIDDYSRTGSKFPEWIKQLRAVKNGRNYIIPCDDEQAWFTYYTFSTYCPLGIIWLAKCFYPNEFADIDFHQYHKEFCLTVYGQDFAKKPVSVK